MTIREMQDQESLISVCVLAHFKFSLESFHATFKRIHIGMAKTLFSCSPSLTVNRAAVVFRDNAAYEAQNET